MVGTLASVVFIVGVGAGAVYMSRKDTVIRGSVMAAEILEKAASKGVTEVTCDDAPITKTGAVMICRIAGNDGSRATIEYTLDREGAPSARQLGESTFDRPEGAPAERDSNADPWTR